MNINVFTAAALAIAAFTGTAVAADNQPRDAQSSSSQATAATHGSAAAGKLEVGSISRRGNLARFDVTRHNDTSAPDRVRYVVHCKEGTFAVAAKVDTDAAKDESNITPPGTANWKKPQSGSEEAHWVQQACRG